MTYGVRNVVEFQIQKDFPASVDDLAHNWRTGRHEQLAADLEHSGEVMELLDEMKRFFARADIQCDDDFPVHCFICPLRSRSDERPFRFKNFSRPRKTCKGAFGS